VTLRRALAPVSSGLATLGLPCRTIYLSLAVLLLLLLLVIAQSQSGGGAGAPTKSRAYTQLDASKGPPSPRDYIAQARAARERERRGAGVCRAHHAEESGWTLSRALAPANPLPHTRTPCRLPPPPLLLALPLLFSSPRAGAASAATAPPAALHGPLQPPTSPTPGPEGLEGGQGGAAGKEVGAGELESPPPASTVPARLLASAHTCTSPRCAPHRARPSGNPLPSSLLLFSQVQPPTRLASAPGLGTQSSGTKLY